MDPMPLAGLFPATRADALATERYPLAWLQCRDCGLVNVEPDIADEVLYRTYSYAASTVPGLVRHHGEFARMLVGAYGAGPLRYLEVGCNDGVLLDQLPATWERVGIDPSDVAAAANPGDLFVNRPMSTGVAPLLGTFDLVTSSNSFAHFTAIADAVDAVRMVLRPRGEFWLEVHDLDATLASGQWDTIYHEHKVEWSTYSLAAVAARHGLVLRSLFRLPLHGGLLRARFTRGDVRPPPARLRVFDSLQRAYDERVPPPLAPGSAAYGAAARASVYLNQVDTGIDRIVDGSPLRSGRFLAGIGIPVITPEAFDADPPPSTLITAWNHAADIRARHPRYRGWVTAW
jgi:SAM-dependent methyltransferase